MRIRRHNSFTSGPCLFNKRKCPLADMGDESVRARTDVQAQISCNLLVTTTAGVQLESEVTNCFDQLHLYEVVNVFGIRALVHPLLRIISNASRGNVA